MTALAIYLLIGASIGFAATWATHIAPKIGVDAPGPAQRPLAVALIIVLAWPLPVFLALIVRLTEAMR